MGILGLGLCFGRGISAASVLPFSIPISPSAWSTREATDDADTRKVYVQLNIAEEAEYLFGVYRGTNAAGNLTQIGQMSHDGTRYTWQSSGQASPGSTNFTRLAYRPSDLSAGWAWLTDAFDTKPFTISDVPGAPSFTWAPLSTGSVRLTIATPITNGRTVTAGAYQIDGGSFTSFTPAATLDVSGLTDGVATNVGLRWTNVNGDSGVTTVSVTAEGEAPVPPSPDVAYTVDGSGTAATLYLSAFDYDTADIGSVRYTIDGGSPVVVSGVGPIALTGLSASQSIAVEWANANGYSEATTVTVVAALPTYGAGDWSLADAETGDILTVTVTADPTSAGASFVSRQYRIGAGAWTALPASGDIATGAVDVAANVQLRPVYDIGPGVASDTKTATPTSPAMEPVRAVIRSRGAGASSSGSTTTHTFSLPAGAVAGDQVIYQIGFDGNPGALTVASGTGWTVSSVTVGTGSDVSMVTAFKELNGSGDDLVLTSANPEQSGFLSWALSTWGDDPIFAVDVATANGFPDSPTLSFGGDLPFVVVTGTVYSQASGIQTAGPTGYSQFRNQNSATNGSASCRVAAAELEVDGTAEDPPAWGVSVLVPISLTIGFPPATSIAATDTLNTTVSATAIENGQSVTFTAQANGNPNITYELTIDGTTETIVASNNLPVTFTVTPSTGSQAWTLTATNAAGSDSDSGTITVAENLIFTTSSVNALALTVQADSVSHTVTPASYELEWDTAGGSAPATIAQVSPTVALTLPDYGAYQFRVRAIDAGDVAGDWSDYKYYWAMQQDRITWRGENAAAVQVSPGSSQAPVEVVPVSGRQVRVYEPWPAVATEIWGSTTHYLNGVMMNPSAFTGRGPQGWDSRTGDRNNILALQSGFDASLIHTSWPASCPAGTTFSKVASRPSSLIDTTGNGQGYRSGLPDQHGGLVVKAALSTSSPYQFAPAIIKESGWVSDSVSLSNAGTVVDAFVASNLSTTGMTVPSASTIQDRLCRFDPSMKLLRGGNYWQDDSEAHRPYITNTGSGQNYYGFWLDGWAVCAAMATGFSSDFKANVIRHLMLRGHQQDFPGADFRVGAGISLDNTLPVALSRIAKGLPFDDLATTQREIVPYMYDYFDATTAGYMEPHDDIARPIFSRWKTPLAITTTATGYDIQVPFNINTGTGERKQSFVGLEILRESTGERLPWGGGTGRNYSGPTTIYRTTGFFSTPPTTSDRFCLQIPSAAMGAFAAGQPFWMYDTIEVSGVMQYDWNSFNPSASMSYRNIPDPKPLILALHLLGEYPATAGSKWQAAKDYSLRAAEAAWPSASMNYAATGPTFVKEFWDAHAAGLGITL